MAKTIAVQDGLHDVAAKLKELGYNVVGINELQYPLDAIVYSSSLSDASSLSDTSNKIQNLEMAGAYNDGYVLMLNIDEFTFEELITQLKEI